MYSQRELDEMIRVMNGGGQQGLYVSEEKIALFVERCYKEKGYCRETLLQQISYLLQQAPVISGGYAQVLPYVREYLLRG